MAFEGTVDLRWAVIAVLVLTGIAFWLGVVWQFRHRARRKTKQRVPDDFFEQLNQWQLQHRDRRQRTIPPPPRGLIDDLLGQFSQDLERVTQQLRNNPQRYVMRRTTTVTRRTVTPTPPAPPENASGTAPAPVGAEPPPPAEPAPERQPAVPVEPPRPRTHWDHLLDGDEE